MTRRESRQTLYVKGAFTKAMAEVNAKLEMKDLMKCPTCSGSGTFLKAQLPDDEAESHYQHCHHCDGTGQLRF